MIGCFERTHGSSEQGAHFFIFHFFKIFQIEDNALFLGQGVNGFLEFELRGVAVEIGVSFQVFDFRREFFRFSVKALHGAAFSEKGQAFVDGDSVEPRADFALCTKRVQSHPSFEKGVLHDVVGVVVKLHDATHAIVESRSFLLHQNAKRLLPCGRIEKAFYQALVRNF